MPVWICAFLFLVLTQHPPRESTEQDHKGIKPITSIQKLIDRTTLSILGGNRDFDMLLQEFRSMSQDNYRLLIQQLLYHRVQAEKLQNGVAPAMVGRIIMKALFIQPAYVRRSLLPVLETDALEDREYKKILYEWLAASDCEPRIEFGTYESILHGESPDQPPLGMMRYLYETAPGQALLSLRHWDNRIEWKNRKSIVWAEHTVAENLWKWDNGFLKRGEVEPEARKQLDFLAKHDAWWVRLYVAAIFRKHPEFQTPVLVKRLQADPHPLVREFVEEGIRD